MIQLDFCSWT